MKFFFFFWKTWGFSFNAQKKPDVNIFVHQNFAILLLTSLSHLSGLHRRRRRDRREVLPPHGKKIVCSFLLVHQI